MALYDVDTTVEGHAGLDSKTFRNLGSSGQYFKVRHLDSDEYDPIFVNGKLTTVLPLESEYTYEYEDASESFVKLIMETDTTVSVNAKFMLSGEQTFVIGIVDAPLITVKNSEVECKCSGMDYTNYSYYTTSILTDEGTPTGYGSMIHGDEHDRYTTSHPRYRKAQKDVSGFGHKFTKLFLSSTDYYTVSIVIDSDISCYFNGELFFRLTDGRQQIRDNVTYSNPTFVPDPKYPMQETCTKDFYVGAQYTGTTTAPSEYNGIILAASKVEEGVVVWKPGEESPQPPEQSPMILNDALDVYLGPYPVSRVYMGDYLIWQRLTMPYMEGVQNYYDCRRGVGNPEDPNDKNWYNLVSDQYPMQLTSVNIADDGSVRFWGPYKAEEDDDPNPGTTVNTVHGAFVSPESNDQTVYIVYKVCSEYSTPVETDGILMSSKEHTSETKEEPVTELIGVTPYANVRYTYKDLYGDESVGIIDAQYYEASYNEYCVVAFKKDTNSGLTLVRSFLNGKLLGLGVANEVLDNGKFWGVCGKGKEWLESDKNHEDAPLQNVNSNNIGFPEINVKMIAVANVAHSDEKILQNCRFLMDQYNTADDMANFAPMDGLEFNGSQIVDTHFVVRNGLMGAKNPWVRIIVKLQNYESGGVYGNYEDGRYAPTLGACFIGSGNYGYMYAGLGKDTLWKSVYYDIKPNDSSVWECTMAVNLQTRQVNLSYKNKSLTSYYKIDPDHPTTTLLEKAIQLGYSDGVTGSSNLKATVLSFQIKDGTGKLLVDMVPMKRRSGGQLGMYDRACSKFRALTDI